MSKKIKVDKDLVEKLEKAHYEYNSHMQVIKSFLEDHSLDVDGKMIQSPIFQSYNDATIKKFKDYEELKNELSNKYQLQNSNWNLDFKTYEVTVH